MMWKWNTRAMFEMSISEELYPVVKIYPNSSLQLIGEGELRKKLEVKINDLGLRSKIKLLGRRNDVPVILKNSDFFVFPSYYEGLGGALVEAFAAKLPCVCSSIPVLKEVVGKEDGSLFAAPGDHEKLGDQIVALYENEKLRTKLSSVSYRRFHEKFIKSLYFLHENARVSS